MQVDLIEHLPLVDEVFFTFEQAVLCVLFLDDRLIDELFDSNCVSLLVVPTHEGLSRAQVGWETTMVTIALPQKTEVLLLRETW